MISLSRKRAEQSLLRDLRRDVARQQQEGSAAFHAHIVVVERADGQGPHIGLFEFRAEQEEACAQPPRGIDPITVEKRRDVLGEERGGALPGVRRVEAVERPRRRPSTALLAVRQPGDELRLGGIDHRRPEEAEHIEKPRSIAMREFSSLEEEPHAPPVRAHFGITLRQLDQHGSEIRSLKAGCKQRTQSLEAVISVRRRSTFVVDLLRECGAHRRVRQPPPRELHEEDR